MFWSYLTASPVEKQMTQHYFVRPTPQIQPLPGVGVAVSVPVVDLGEYLFQHRLRVKKCYWTARGECVVTVALRGDTGERLITLPKNLRIATPTLRAELISNRRFVVSDLKTYVDGTYEEVLRDARERAAATPNGIIIAAYHRGGWYKIDVAYSDKEHAQ